MPPRVHQLARVGHIDDASKPLSRAKSKRVALMASGAPPRGGMSILVACH